MKREGCKPGEKEYGGMCLSRDKVKDALNYYDTISRLISEKEYGAAGDVVNILKYHPEIKKQVINQVESRYGKSMLKKIKKKSEQESKEFVTAVQNWGTSVLAEKYNIPQNLNKKEFKKRLRKAIDKDLKNRDPAEGDHLISIDDFKKAIDPYPDVPLTEKKKGSKR